MAVSQGSLSLPLSYPELLLIFKLEQLGTSLLPPSAEIQWLTYSLQDISTSENSNAVWNMAWPTLGRRLGPFTQGTSLGEPFDGMAVECRLYAG
jgi:hypothetical protein